MVESELLTEFYHERGDFSMADEMTNEELVAAIQAGERDKLSQLWAKVERFAAMQARKMAAKAQYRAGVTADDFCQCGYIALVGAAETFRPEAGAQFLTWYMFYLQNEFALVGGWKTKRLMNDPLRNATSLDAPISSDEDEETTLEELCADPDSSLGFDLIEERAWRNQLREALEDALDKIPERESEAIRQRYFQGSSLEQTGAVLGVSRERARQIEEKALRSLRQPEVSASLAEFLEVKTPYYMRVGVQEFSHTHESAVEKIVLLRERLQKQFYNGIIGGQTDGYTRKIDTVSGIAL